MSVFLLSSVKEASVLLSSYAKRTFSCRIRKKGDCLIDKFCKQGERLLVEFARNLSVLLLNSARKASVPLSSSAKVSVSLMIFYKSMHVKW